MPLTMLVSDVLIGYVPCFTVGKTPYASALYKLGYFTSTSTKKDDALFIYAVSLVLNFSWSIFFFNLQSFVVSFVILLALWLSIIITIIQYYKINKAAAWLQVPYLLWVTFAGYLNLAIIFLN